MSLHPHAYSPMIKRTSINLDLDLGAQARDVLETETATDTVHRALEEVIRRDALRSLAAWRTGADARGARPHAPRPAARRCVTELADTSAWTWSDRDPAPREAFDKAIVGGVIGTSDPVKLELLSGTRNAAEFSEVRTRLDYLKQCPTGAREFRRALDIYEVLAQQGAPHHRRIPHVDLLVAAAAESARMTVSHYDADFDAIAAVTGQPTRWLAQRGSL